MHDWTLVGLAVDWPAGTVSVKFRNRSAAPEVMEATGVRSLHVTRLEPWGPSVSVDRVAGPEQSADGTWSVEIGLQSGDVIRIEAAHLIKMPVGIEGGPV